MGAAVVAALIVCSVTLGLPAGSFNDDAVYLALGRSIAEGKGYHSIYLVGEPVQTKFPPLLPAILSFGWLLGDSVNAARLLGVSVNLIACGLAAGLLWWIGRAHLRIPMAAMLVVPVLGFLLDPSVQYFTLVLSEPLFICTTAATMALTVSPTAIHGRRAIAIGALLAAATLSRSQGIVLVPAFVAALALDRVPWRALALIAVVAVVPVAVWQGAVALAASGNAVEQASERGYVGFMLSGTPADVVTRELRYMWFAARGYAATLALLVSDNVGVGGILVAGLVAAAVAGARKAWREAKVVLFGGASLILVVAAWPVFGDRFLVPALPFAALLAAAGLGALLTAVTGLARWPITVACIAFPAFVLWRQADIRTPGTPGTQPMLVTPSMWIPGNAMYLQALSEWTRRMTRPADRIATASAAGLWLYTGRQTEVTEFAEPIGAPSVYSVPGRFLSPLLEARRIDVIVVEAPGSGIAREVDFVRSRCPETLVATLGFAGREYPRFYRVAASARCDLPVGEP